MIDYGYGELLTRAKANLPKEVKESERFKIPEADLFIEGKSTVVKNFGDIVEAIRREPSDLMAYLQRELGTPGIVEGKRAIFKSRLGVQQIQSRLKAYVNTFVLCSECNRPDTHFIKEGRTDVLECEACGARRPVGVRKSITTEYTKAALAVDGTYEVMIQDIGSKGDGIAKLDKYTIFIPGTAKGAVVKVKIDSIQGQLAFGKVVNE